MPRKSSDLRDLKSAIGKGKELGMALVEAIEDADGDEQIVRRFLSDHRLQKLVGEIIVAHGAEFYPLAWEAFDPDMEFTPRQEEDYESAINEWIQITFHVDDSRIFKAIHTGKEIELYREPRYVAPMYLHRAQGNSKAVETIIRRGLHPASLRQLIGFGAQHPSVAESIRMLVAPGSVAELGGRHVAVLRGDPATHQLKLEVVEAGSFGPDVAFLTVRSLPEESRRYW